MLIDNRDPTTALFTQLNTAYRAGREAERRFPDRVRGFTASMRQRRGENLGYQVIIHFNDGRHSTPLTNSDADELLS